MTERIPRVEYPWWVKLCLWGNTGRSGLWACAFLSVLIAVGCIVYGFVDPRFFGGAIMFYSARKYWQAIRWIDRHGSW